MPSTKRSAAERQGRAASRRGGASASPALGFEPAAFFFERRSSLSLARLDGRTAAPLRIDESGCRIEGSSGGRARALVLDEPAPEILESWARGAGGGTLSAARAVPDLTATAGGALAGGLDRWSGEIRDRARGVPFSIGARLEAIVTLSSVAAGPVRGGHLVDLSCDSRSALEARLALTIRSADRSARIEASRWAPADLEMTADSILAAVRAWDGVASEAVALLIERLDAAPPPSMESPVIFTPAAAGVLLHEIVGHLLEADLVAAGASPFGALLGERVAPQWLTLLDEPRRPGSRVFMARDDEGTETRATMLIDSGVLAGFLSDARRAGATGGRSNGHARRDAYRHPALPRMTNLVMRPGPHDPGDLTRSVTRGLLVEGLGRGQVDPRRGDFRLEVTAGRLIEDGAAGRPVGNAFLVGSCRDLLMSLEAAGPDTAADLSAGACIKDDQIVPVGQSAPTLRASRARVLPGAAS